MRRSVRSRVRCPTRASDVGITRKRAERAVPSEKNIRAHPRGGEILAGNRVRIQHAEITVRRRVGAGVQRARGAGGDVPLRTPVRVIDKIAERAGNDVVGTETRGGRRDARPRRRGWTAGGSREGYGDEEEGRSRSPEFGYASPESAERGQSRSGTGKRRARAESIRASIRTPTNTRTIRFRRRISPIGVAFPCLAIEAPLPARAGTRGRSSTRTPRWRRRRGEEIRGAQKRQDVSPRASRSRATTRTSRRAATAGACSWNKETCELVCRAQADGQVVNNVCPHPSLPVLVTSGIDDEIEYGNRRGTPPRRNSNAKTKTRTTTRRQTSRTMSWRSSSAGSTPTSREPRTPRIEDDEDGGFPRDDFDEDLHDEAFASSPESRDDDRPPIHHERRRRRGRPRIRCSAWNGTKARTPLPPPRTRLRRRRNARGSRGDTRRRNAGCERLTRTRAKTRARRGARTGTRRWATGRERTRRNYGGVKGRGPRPEIRDERRRARNARSAVT